MRDDLSYKDILTRLNDMAETIAADMIPDGRREGTYWRGDCHGKCSVHIRGARVGLVGFWQGQKAGANGGNLIDLIEIAMGFSSHGEAVRFAKERYLGITKRELTPEEKRQWAKSMDAAKRKAAKRQAEAEKKKAQKVQTVRSVWQEGRPIAGTLAEAYLRSRSIDFSDWPASLRFHPQLRYSLDKPGPNCRYFPALICGVQAVDRKLIALWQIFLDPETGGKAKLRDGESAKLGFGPAAGGAVRLGPVTPTLRVTEGVETAMGVRHLTKGTASVWATLSTSGMIGFQIPEGVERLEIYADGDRHRLNRRTGAVAKPPGIKAAEQLAERARSEGVEAVVFPSPEPDDWLDVWQARKADDERIRSVQYGN